MNVAPAPGIDANETGCVVIDGGEWLKAGQEFSRYTDQPRADVKAAFSAMRPKKG